MWNDHWDSRMTYYSTSWLVQHNRAIRLCSITGRVSPDTMRAEGSLPFGRTTDGSQAIGSNWCDLAPSLPSRRGFYRKSGGDSAACSNWCTWWVFSHFLLSPTFWGQRSGCHFDSLLWAIWPRVDSNFFAASHYFSASFRMTARCY